MNAFMAAGRTVIFRQEYWSFFYSRGVRQHIRGKIAMYSNATWQTVKEVEDLLYEKGFSNRHRAVYVNREHVGTGSRPSRYTLDNVKRPEMVLLCNMNFFEVKDRKKTKYRVGLEQKSCQ
ncbi:MAG: hypothetical protein EOM12_04250 [Verrucomicrobiae bacterium]|nr:hypothetical protein [Verrucomicrobiae bacterium]